MQSEIFSKSKIVFASVDRPTVVSLFFRKRSSKLLIKAPMDRWSSLNRPYFNKKTFLKSSTSSDEPDIGGLESSADVNICRNLELKMSAAVATLNNVGQIEAGSHEHLREVCMAHLNLIHKMSEAILAKDRQIKSLKESNFQVKWIVILFNQ